MQLIKRIEKGQESVSTDKVIDFVKYKKDLQGVSCYIQRASWRRRLEVLSIMLECCVCLALVILIFTATWHLF